MIADTKFGFVGTGTMSSAIVRGLATLPTPPAIFVSPRNAEKAAALAKEFSCVTVCSDNQSVVDAADVVMVGVLPKQTEETVRALRFTSRQTLVSLVSTAKLAGLREWSAAGEAPDVVRAIPLPPVAHHMGSCVMTPQHDLVSAVFDALGTAVAVDTEEEMMKLMPVTCVMGQLYAQQRAIQVWLEEQGLAPGTAAKWVGAVFHTVTSDGKQAGPDTFQHLVDEQTPGGLNEQVIGELTQGGVYTELHSALDGCLARIEGKDRPPKRQRTSD